MSTLKLIIRDYKGCRNKDGTSLVFLQYVHQYQTTTLSTGEKVPIHYWDKKRQEVRKSYSGYTKLNMVLHKFKKRVENIVHDAKLFNIEPTVEYVKDQLRAKQDKTKPEIPTLFRFIEQYIEEQVALKRPHTIRSYKTSLRQLKEYRDHVNQPLNYGDITMEFYNSFLSFLYKTRKLSINSAGSHIKNIKVWMGHAYDKGYHANTAWRNKNFRVLTEISDGIYCTEQEIELLYNYDFSYDNRLERTRDTFIIGIFTGLRYSDLSRLQAANIQNGTIVCNTIKTDERVVLPIHPKVKTIIEKYQSNTDSPFPVFFKGEQKFNVHLKEVARIVGGPFSQSVIKRISRAGKKQEIVIPKSELMCSHVARRTCATNLSKAGIPITVIQKITGHKSLRSLSIYLKQSQTDAADMLQQFWNKQDSNSHTAVNTSTVTATIG